MSLAPRTTPRAAFDLDALAAALTGTLLRPDDVEYDVARRGHNLAYDGRPAAIVRVADAEDVAVAIRAARAAGLELAIRSGGHSVAGHSTGDGVLVIDMTALTGLHIDPDTRLVYAGPGLTAGAVTAALAEHGLAIPFGDTSTVGIAGLTLGGGIGYLARSFGLAIDHLEAVELVTADGHRLVANDTEHPDLFWALRGGGGNFGVVTRFVYRAVAVDQVYGGALFLPATPDVLAGVVAAAADAPDGLTTIVDVFPAPPMPFLDPAWIGRPVLSLTAVFAGDPADGPTVMAPFRALAAPLADFLGPMPYPAIYGFTEEAGQPSAYHLRSSFLTSFGREDAATVLAAFEGAPADGMSLFHIRVLGGAMARVPADATAFAHRDAPILSMQLSSFEDGDGAAQRDWVTGVHETLQPRAHGVYANFLGDEGERVREAYPTETYDRLAAIKRAYDPSNVFHRNQNIRPAR